jgi:glycolate dehydrogenase FAD-binding subunit
MGDFGKSTSDPSAGQPTSDPVAALIRPTSPREVADALHRAADARRTILIRGAGTKLDWGRPTPPVDCVLDMRTLNRVLAHEHGDMTATVEAGATLADLNRTLAEHGQWLPLDPPHADTATIGGILATNDSGPLRHRFGTPRDLLIGIQLATTDGTLANAGGRVVKNVAGYDLGKLVTGSFGGLAAIVSATFKLSPLPAASKTLRLEVGDPGVLAELVQKVLASQLEPIAFEFLSSRSASANSTTTVLLRFSSLPAVVDAQVPRAAAALTRFAANGDRGTRATCIVDGDAEQTLWREHRDAIFTGDSDDAIVRASWLPASLDRAIAAAPGAAIGRAAVGAGLMRIPGDADAQARAISQLRASPVVGNVVVVRGSPELKARVDVWGSAGDRQPIFDALKRALDPHNILNAGRGPM